MFPFPFPPYSVQVAFRQALTDVLDSRGVGIFESPTGTGKTLAILTGVLAWLFSRRSLLYLTDVPMDENAVPDWMVAGIRQQRKAEAEVACEEDLRRVSQVRELGKRFLASGQRQEVALEPLFDATRKVVICSRTHSQLAQYHGELRRIEGGAGVGMVSLASRNVLCVHPGVRALPKGLVRDSCRKLVSESGCCFHNGLNSFAAAITSKSMDIEECVSWGMSHMLCPYYATKKAAALADVVLMPYTSLFVPGEVDFVTNNVLILDEGHNVLDSVVEAQSKEVSQRGLLTLDRIMEIAVKTVKPSSKVRLKQWRRLNRALLDLIRSESGALDCQAVNRRLGPSLEILGRWVDQSNIVHQLYGIGLANEPDSSAVFAARDVLLLLVRPFEHAVVVVEQNESLCIFVRGAEHGLKSLVERAHGVILAGGTMQPRREFDAFKGLLTCPTTEFTGEHVVARERYAVHAVTSVDGEPLRLTFNQRERSLPWLECVTGLALEINHEGSVLFFPSFSFLGLFKDYIASRNWPMFFEEKGRGSDVLFAYSTAINSGQQGVLAAVVGGSLSEGVDFKDGLARLVVIVGLPYPPDTPKLAARQQYLDAFGARVDVREVKCAKSVNQAVGRALRHKDDWAALVLLDVRYVEKRTRSQLSSHSGIFLVYIPQMTSKHVDTEALVLASFLGPPTEPTPLGFDLMTLPDSQLLSRVKTLPSSTQILDSALYSNADVSVLEACGSLFSSIKKWKNSAELQMDGFRPPCNSPVLGPSTYDLYGFVSDVCAAFGEKDSASTAAGSNRPSIGSSGRPSLAAEEEYVLVQSNGKYGVQIELLRYDILSVIVRNGGWFQKMLIGQDRVVHFPFLLYNKSDFATTFTIEATTPADTVSLQVTLLRPSKETMLQSTYHELLDFLNQYPGFTSSMHQQTATGGPVQWVEIVDAARDWLSW